MKHILMIATGGTIASKETADGLAPQLTSEELLAEVPELEQLCRIDTVQLMNRDSTNINSRDWLQMAACVREHYDAYDGFVASGGEQHRRKREQRLGPKRNAALQRGEGFAPQQPQHGQKQYADHSRVEDSGQNRNLRARRASGGKWAHSHIHRQ